MNYTFIVITLLRLKKKHQISPHWKLQKDLARLHYQLHNLITYKCFDISYWFGIIKALDTVLWPTLKIKIKQLNMGWWAMSKQIIPNVMYHHQTIELYQLLSMKNKEMGKRKQTAISWMYSTYPCILQVPSHLPKTYIVLLYWQQFSKNQLHFLLLPVLFLMIMGNTLFCCCTRMWLLLKQIITTITTRNFHWTAP